MTGPPTAAPPWRPPKVIAADLFLCERCQRVLDILQCPEDSTLVRLRGLFLPLSLNHEILPKLRAIEEASADAWTSTPDERARCQHAEERDRFEPDRSNQSE